MIRTLSVSIICLTLTLALTAMTALAAPVPQEADPSPEFEEIGALRAQGRYDEAIAKLQKIIEEYSDSDEVLMRAYNELVFSLLKKRDGEQDPEKSDRIYAEAETEATRALKRYPNLTVDRVRIGESVRDLYRYVRTQIFGRLRVTSVPDTCRVFIDEELIGSTPLNIQYFPKGEYELLLTKSGFVDYSTDLTVLPNQANNMSPKLQKERTKKWWITRVFAPVAVGVGAIAALIIANQDEPPPPVVPDAPLPTPPDPPTQ